MLQQDLSMTRILLEEYYKDVIWQLRSGVPRLQFHRRSGLVTLPSVGAIP